jgi:Bacterial membrane protein YfhO
MIACETTFLMVAGRPSLIPPPSIGVSPTDVALKSKAGAAIVGFGANQCFDQLNTTPELNDEFGVHELNAYDPMLPRSYFSAWSSVAGTNAGPDQFLQPRTVFCPAISTADLARLFGVSLVVTAHGSPGPSGSVFDGTLGKIDLYRIPGAAVATVSPLGPGGALPPPTAPASPVPATQPYPGAWKVTTNQQTSQVLRLRVTDVPGWHATIDGRPLRLRPFEDVMIQARVPPGAHTIVFTYWPTAFTIGLGLAGVSFVGIVTMLVVEARRHKRLMSRSDPKEAALDHNL